MQCVTIHQEVYSKHIYDLDRPYGFSTRFPRCLLLSDPASREILWQKLSNPQTSGFQPTNPTLPSPSNSSFCPVQQVAHFSYDDQRQLHHDASSLRSYYPPELGSNLSNGFEQFDKHDDSIDEHLDGLLVSLIELEKKTNTRCSADIITWRGMMTKVRPLVIAVPLRTAICIKTSISS